MSKRFDKTGADSDHVEDLLSAYIDNALGNNEQSYVRKHLELCADCRAGYIELRATQRMIQSLPTVPPPRAFTLTQDMVATKQGFWQSLLTPRNSQRFALGSALSFTLLVFMLIGNLVMASGSLARYNSAPSASVALAPLEAQPGVNLDAYSKRQTYTDTTNQEIAYGEGVTAGGSAASAPTMSADLSQNNVQSTALGTPALSNKSTSDSIATPSNAFTESTPVTAGAAPAGNANPALPPSQPIAPAVTTPATSAEWQAHVPLNSTTSLGVSPPQPTAATVAERTSDGLSPIQIAQASLAVLTLLLAIGAFLARRH